MGTALLLFICEVCVFMGSEPTGIYLTTGTKVGFSDSDRRCKLMPKGSKTQFSPENKPLFPFIGFSKGAE